MVATLVGFLTIILAVWLQWKDGRAWIRRLGWAALAAVIAQGVLGGLTVLYLLPKYVSISHACLAQLFFSTTVAITVFTSRAWREEDHAFTDSGVPSIRALAISVPLLALAQVAMGAGFRHKAFGIVPHLVGALVVSLLLVYFAMCVLTQYSPSRLMRRTAKATLWITFAQVVLGVAAYFARLTVAGDQPEWVMVSTTVAHVATGALTLASTTVLSILCLRFVHQANEAAATEAARA
jgi:cytochrome c oxidase assembly protein subunit 15